jgi:hypothetical protein
MFSLLNRRTSVKPDAHIYGSEVDVELVQMKLLKLQIILILVPDTLKDNLGFLKEAYTAFLTS